MKYQQQLQVAVRERFRRLMTASPDSASHEVHLTVTWIKGKPALRGLLEGAGRAEPGLDWEQFRQGLTHRGQFAWTSRTEEGRAFLIWGLMQEIAAEDDPNSQAGLRISMGCRSVPELKAGRLIRQWEAVPTADRIGDGQRISDLDEPISAITKRAKAITWMPVHHRKIAFTRKSST